MKVPALPIPSHPTHSVLDSSKISEYITCERMSLFRTFLGLVLDRPNHNLIFGSAWHAAREVLLQSNYDLASIQPAYAAFLELYRTEFPASTDFDFNGKNPQQVLQALHDLCNDPTERPHELLATETHGSVMLDSDTSLVYKMDAICKDSAGKVYSLEFKSGSYKFAWWIDEKRVRFQIKCYNHALFSSFPADQVAGVLVKGTLFRKSEIEPVEVLIRCTPIDLENWMFEAKRHVSNLQRDLNALSQADPADKILYAFPRRVESCIKYNKMCPYYNICFSNTNPLRFAELLPTGFKREFWDPRGEETQRIKKDEH